MAESGATDRDWRAAKAWLYLELSPLETGDAASGEL